MRCPGTLSKASASVELTMAVPSKGIGGQVHQFAEIEQRFARNAADVQAGAAQAGAPIDARHFHSELRRADRRDIAPGTRPNHYQVETLGHRASPLAKSVVS